MLLKSLKIYIKVIHSITGFSVQFSTFKREIKTKICRLLIASLKNKSIIYQDNIHVVKTIKKLYKSNT